MRKFHYLKPKKVLRPTDDIGLDASAVDRIWPYNTTLLNNHLVGIICQHIPYLQIDVASGRNWWRKSPTFLSAIAWPFNCCAACIITTPSLRHRFAWLVSQESRRILVIYEKSSRSQTLSQQLIVRRQKITWQPAYSNSLITLDPSFFTTNNIADTPYLSLQYSMRRWRLVDFWCGRGFGPPNTFIEVLRGRNKVSRCFVLLWRSNCFWRNVSSYPIIAKFKPALLS